MILNEEEIEYFKQNKHLITSELLDTLRNQGKDGRQIAIEILDLNQDSEKYYLDAFNNRISYNGDRGIKKAFTSLPLSNIHFEEIEKCKNSIQYFMQNYVKIVTPKGVNFPDLREYQKEFIDILNKPENESIISLQGRQCISSDTKVIINNEEKSIEDFFNTHNKIYINYNKSEKYTDSVYPKSKFIKTDIGEIQIKAIHKTIPLPMCEIKTKSFSLKCAKNHKIIGEFGDEISAFESLHRNIKTANGLETVISVCDLHKDETCYDLELFNHHLYYSNGILSHNSGKSVTIAIWICWAIIFEKNINIGICANKFNMAQEFIDKIRKIFYNLPIWMTPGCVVWNKQSLEFENRVKIMCDATSENSFRGFTMNYIVVDETAFISPNIFQEFMDSIMPSQSALSKKKNILISTANGQNHFYEIWSQASENLEDSKNGFIRYEVDYTRVPRYDTNGNLIKPEDFKESIIKKYGLKYFEQNYGNSFIGSSNTLISGQILSTYKTEEVDFIMQPGLKIYKESEPSHKYVMGIDTSKNGGDYFCIQVLDITTINFKQVASAKLQIDYLKMPEIIVEWANYYNKAMVIIENNEGSGQSVADMLKLNYEYENLYFDKGKKYPGFRTTRVSRDIILQTLKTIAESKKLEIVDKDTIKELFNFVLVNNKFQADNGKHDDLVMALAICFAIFTSTKNFDDIKNVIEAIKTEDSDYSFVDDLVIGDFDIYYDNDDINSKYVEML